MKGRNDITPAKASTAHYENPADAEAAKAVADGLAAGEDVFGDFDDDAATASAAAAPAPAAAAADDGAAAGADDASRDLDDGDDTANQEAAAAAEADAAAQAAEASRQAANEAEQATKPTPDPTPAPSPAPQQFKVKSAKELADAEKALLGEKAEAFERYSNGTMTAAEYSEVDSRVMKGLIGLASETALAQANAQTALQASEQALANVKQLAKTQGLVDYDADQEAATQFDNVVDMLSKDPKAAALSDADFFSKTHATVLLLRGLTPPATAPATAAPAKPRQDMTGPITLRQLPAAATPNATGGVAEQLSRLEGLDFEDAVGAMSRQQRDQWLDS